MNGQLYEPIIIYANKGKRTSFGSIELGLLQSEFECIQSLLPVLLENGYISEDRYYDSLMESGCENIEKIEDACKKINTVTELQDFIESYENSYYGESWNVKINYYKYDVDIKTNKLSLQKTKSIFFYEAK